MPPSLFHPHSQICLATPHCCCCQDLQPLFPAPLDQQLFRSIQSTIPQLHFCTLRSCTLHPTPSSLQPFAHQLSPHSRLALALRYPPSLQPLLRLPQHIFPLRVLRRPGCALEVSQGISYKRQLEVQWGEHGEGLRGWVSRLCYAIPSRSSKGEGVPGGEERGSNLA